MTLKPALNRGDELFHSILNAIHKYGRFPCCLCATLEVIFDRQCLCIEKQLHQRKSPATGTAYTNVVQILQEKDPKELLRIC